MSLHESTKFMHSCARNVRVFALVECLGTNWLMWLVWCVVTREYVLNLQAATEQNPLKGSRPIPVFTFTVFYPKLMLCGIHRLYDQHIVNSLVGHSGIRQLQTCAGWNPNLEENPIEYTQKILMLWWLKPLSSQITMASLYWHIC